MPTPPAPALLTAIAAFFLVFAVGCAGSPGKADLGHVAFFGSSSSDGPPNKSIVFVVDATGSMIPIYTLVTNEVRRVIYDLLPIHHVTVICYSGEGVYEFTGDDGQTGLRSATPEFKRKAREWVSPASHSFPMGGGSSWHPVEAIELALSYQPDLIYLLTDGFTGARVGGSPHMVDMDNLIQRITEINARAEKPTKINAIQFVYRDPLELAGEESPVKRIADATGGTYLFVDEQRLGLR